MAEHSLEDLRRYFRSTIILNTVDNIPVLVREVVPELPCIVDGYIWDRAGAKVGTHSWSFGTTQGVADFLGFVPLCGYAPNFQGTADSFFCRTPSKSSVRGLTRDCVWATYQDDIAFFGNDVVFTLRTVDQAMFGKYHDLAAATKRVKEGDKLSSAFARKWAVGKAGKNHMVIKYMSRDVGYLSRHGEPILVSAAHELKDAFAAATGINPGVDWNE